MITIPDPIPHGSITGHAAGCKTDKTCPMSYQGQRTCKQVDLLYRGDYRYRKQIDAGMTPAQILAAEQVAEAEAKAARVAARIAAAEPKPKRASRASLTRVTKGIIGPDGYVHGTTTGYRRCKEPAACPAVAAGLMSCREAGREEWRKKHPRKVKVGDRG